MPLEIRFPARLLSLEGAWIDCTATYVAAGLGGLLIVEPEHVVVPGMSGSPLISTSGAALGVMSTNNMAACLTNGLPGWLLLRALACD